MLQQSKRRSEPFKTSHRTDMLEQTSFSCAQNEMAHALGHLNGQCAPLSSPAKQLVCGIHFLSQVQCSKSLLSLTLSLSLSLCTL